jgi:hypothetical protein
VWQSTQWSAPAGTLDFGAKQYWMVMARCPVRAEVIAVCSLQTEILRASVQTSSTWHDLVTATANCGTLITRPFALAYEQVSGRGLMVYRSANSPTIYYQVWNGTAWSAQNSTASTLTGNPLWMTLAPKAGSNEIVLLVTDSNADIAAMVWDGVGFGNKLTLETGASSTSGQCADVAYESGTGRAMVVWGRTASVQPRVRFWNGSWSAETAGPTQITAPTWVKLAPSRTTNSVLMGTLDLVGRVYGEVWNGTAWGSQVQATLTASATGSRCFDVAFEPDGARGMIMYGTAGVLTPRYRIFDGTSWGSAVNGPTLPSVPLLVQLSASNEGAELMGLINVTGGQNSLHFMRWDGSGLVNYQQLEGNVSGAAGAEVFMIPIEPPNASNDAAIRGWKELAPQ